jgi:hypothetical protein
MKLSVFVLAVMAVLALSSLSCSPKTGCPVTETTKVKTNRKGELKTKSGSTHLFPKHMRRY